MSTAATRDPNNPQPADFPTWNAYQTARVRALTGQRIRNMRATNRHLSIAQIAGHTGVSIAHVKEVLDLPASYPSY